MGNTFGLHTFAVAPAWELARIEPQVERLKEYGVGLFEIPLDRPREIDVKATRAFASRYGVDLVPSLALPPGLDVAGSPSDGLDFLEPAFRACAEIGGFGLTGMTYGARGKITGRAPTTKEIDGICRFLERAAKAARVHGLKLGIEPCNRYETHLVNRAADAARIIERIGADNIVIHLDTFHMQIEEDDFASGFAAAAPFLGYVQVSEANRGVPGRGMLDWTAAFKAIADTGYRGPITLESPVSVDPETAAGLAVWRAVAERPDDVIEAGLPFLRETARANGVDLGR